MRVHYSNYIDFDNKYNILNKEMEAIIMSSNNLVNEHTRPTTDADRDVGFWDYVILWGGIAVSMGSFTVAAQLFPGLSPLKILASILIGLLIVTIVFVLIGDIGIVYGVPFVVYMRGCFGYKGAIVPAALRLIPAVVLFGFQTWVGANAINLILNQVIGNTNILIPYVIFGVLQTINAAYGLKAMAKFSWLAIPGLAILISYVAVWLLTTYDVTVLELYATPADNTSSLAFGIIAVAGIYLTAGVNSPDLTRDLRRTSDHSSDNFLIRNRKPFLAQVLGLVFIATLLMSTGMGGAILTGSSDAVDIVTAPFDSQLWLLVAVIVLAIAQWSTNTVANLLPGANIFTTIFSKLSFAQGTMITGVLGLLSVPWIVAPYLPTFTALVAAILGPLAGIMIADYHILRKRKLNIEEYYKIGGAFTYNNNYNIKAFVIYGISFIVAVFINLDYAFLTSLFISLVLYTLAMKKEIKPYDGEIKPYVGSEVEESIDGMTK